jgi:hypothetical protein
MSRPHKIAFKAATPKAPAIEPKALPITKFARLYGVDPSTVWRSLRDGRLKYVRIGKRRLVLLDSVSSGDPPS